MRNQHSFMRKSANNFDAKGFRNSNLLYKIPDLDQPSFQSVYNGD